MYMHDEYMHTEKLCWWGGMSDDLGCHGMALSAASTPCNRQVAVYQNFLQYVQGPIVFVLSLLQYLRPLPGGLIETARRLVVQLGL